MFQKTFGERNSYISNKKHIRIIFILAILHKRDDSWPGPTIRNLTEQSIQNWSYGLFNPGMHKKSNQALGLGLTWPGTIHDGRVKVQGNHARLIRNYITVLLNTIHKDGVHRVGLWYYTTLFYKKKIGKL